MADQPFNLDRAVGEASRYEDLSQNSYRARQWADQWPREWNTVLRRWAKALPEHKPLCDHALVLPDGIMLALVGRAGANFWWCSLLWDMESGWEPTLRGAKFQATIRVRQTLQSRWWSIDCDARDQFIAAEYAQGVGDPRG